MDISLKRNFDEEQNISSNVSPQIAYYSQKEKRNNNYTVENSSHIWTT